MTANQLDLRDLHPRDRHPLVFSRLAALAAGEALVLVNDHDPVPLHYQLDAVHPQQFAWAYGEEGPERWSVTITNRARTVDARPVIAAGGEPFDTIMEAAAATAEGEVLVVLAPHDPERLKGVLGGQGFTHVTDQPDDGTWRVTFSRT